MELVTIYNIYNILECDRSVVITCVVVCVCVCVCVCVYVYTHTYRLS
jgi:hypothetical protein